ncbi:hypothetical protein QOZ80_4BG0343460 [Eleusine coracana subsp. coracana]|nr:hypothetical protein QOZ80_4BG0343460 [Eleusine coracana subsp. coracana]
MAPPWILLERVVRFMPGGAAVTAGTSHGEAGSTSRGGEQLPAAIPLPRRVGITCEERAAAMAVKIEAMKPDSQASEPPELSCLSMVQQTTVGLSGGIISCTDKSLIVLYAGSYRPGSGSSFSGCYLVYDASDSSHWPSPSFPIHTLSVGLGLELLSSAWEMDLTCLQNLSVQDPSFPMQSSSCGYHPVCWVDLLKGVLVCNLVDYTQPKFTYVPLPMGQSLEFDGRRRPRSKLIRNMGCFCGAIEFAALVGYKESCPGENIMLKTWTLSSDLKDWKKGTEQRVGDLWDSRSFIERRLPRVTPSSPVISIDEPNVVYVILNEIDHVGVVNFGVRGVNMVHKAQYVLRLDTLRNKVLSHSKVILDKLTPRFPNLFATSAFSAHLQSSKNLQVGLEASEAEVSRKQIKHRSEAEGSRKRKNY